MDLVTDFSAADGDILNLADLLVGEEESGDLTEYLNVTEDEDAGNVVINVTPTGTGGDMTQIITLQNTTLAELGANPADSQADIINSLVTSGHINVDQS
jgi:hypothetical protein